MGMEYSNYLVAVLFCLIPLISGVIIYKCYNLIQGFITFLVVSFIMFYSIDLLIGNNTFLSIEQLNLISNMMRIPYNLIYYLLIEIPNLHKVIIVIEPYFIITVVIYFYCLTQLISTTIKRLKKI